MRRETDTVSVLLQLAPQGNEGLNVASTANNLDDNIELYGVFALFGVVGSLLRVGLRLLGSLAWN